MNLLEERALFYYVLGRALEQWAHVEGALEFIATTCVAEPDWPRISAGFASIENFRSKLAFCDALVQSKHAASPHLDRWVKANARCSSHSQTRNKIAHNRHRVYVQATPGRRYALVSAKLGYAGGQPPAGSLCVRDIEAARMEFELLSIELENLFNALLGAPEPFRASPELLARPPTLRALRDQIRVELGVQHRPLRKSRN